MAGDIFPDSGGSGSPKKWHVARLENGPKKEFGNRLPTEEARRLRYETTEIMRRLASSGAIKAYIDTRNQTSDKRLPVSIEVIDEDQAWNFIIGEETNESVFDVSPDGILLGSGKLKHPDLPPGKLFYFGIQEAADKPTEAYAYVTDDGQEVAYTYGGTNSKLERLHASISTTQSIIR